MAACCADGAAALWKVENKNRVRSRAAGDGSFCRRRVCVAAVWLSKAPAGVDASYSR